MATATKAVAPQTPVPTEVKQDVVFVERPRQQSIPKKVGREPFMTVDEAEKSALKFLSWNKNLILYDGSRISIHFDNHMYITDNPVDIDFLKRHPANGDGFWEGKFPKEVVRKFEDEKAHIYRDDDIFVNPD